MKQFYEKIVNFRRPIILVFILLTIACLIMKQFVGVNYDIIDYLPDDSPSTVALNKMSEEFSEGIPNARAMIRNVTIPQALDYKNKLKAVNGVDSVTWLDDSVDITTPLNMIDQDALDSYYRDNDALYSIVINADYYVPAVADIREIIGEDNALSGAAVNTADGTTNTVAEIQLITIIAVAFVLCVLLVSTRSWVEPFIVLAGLGVAILINSGSNLMFGTVSFVTNSAGNVLQLAVSLDYSVFLIHRFEECLAKNRKNPKKAMVEALEKSTTSVLSSGLTTVIGFLAVILMRFKIGPDVGLALAKGVVVSLIVTFTFMPALILATYKWMEKTKHRSFMPTFKRFGKIVGSITVPLVAVFAAIVVPAYLAYNANSYYYGSSHLFDTNTRVGRDAAAIEEVYGENDTYALLVPNGNPANEISLSGELKQIPEVKSIISYADTVNNTIPTSYLDASTLAKLDSGQFRRIIMNIEAPLEGEETFNLVKKVRETAQKYYPNNYYLAGNGVSTYDLMDTITSDMLKVNAVAICAVFVILAITLRSIILPIALILAIETAIALNLSIPYFTGTTVFYVAFLIISSIQLGATIDYAILMTDRYKENRLKLDKKAAAKQTITDVTGSILVSGSVLTVVGFLIGIFSSNQLLSQLGIFIGRGALISLIVVQFVVPGILCLLDKIVMKGKNHEKIKA